LLENKIVKTSEMETDVDLARKKIIRNQETIERNLHEGISAYRALYKSVTCIHLDDFFCTRWTVYKKNPYFELIKKYYDFHYESLDEYSRETNYEDVLQIKGSEPFCQSCNLYARAPRL
jgi:hypothetical protein